MLNISLSLNKDETVALRLDDPEFIEALRDDPVEPDDDNPHGRGPLSILLEEDRAVDFDFAPYIEDGWVIHARSTIGSGEEDAITNAGQRRGGGVDMVALRRTDWQTWVKGVAVPDEKLEGADVATRKAIADLSSTSPKMRGEAYEKLPIQVRRVFSCRLRAHKDAQGQPAKRHEGKG